MRRYRNFLRLCCLLIITVLITGCMRKEQEELTLVTEAGFAPYEYYSKGEIVGVDIEIAQ